jgi:DNA-binding NarL/FixJ family response regulator
MPAVELLAAIRRICPCLRLICKSGKAKLRTAALQAGVELFAYKADSPENLLKLIRSLASENRYNPIAS